MRNVTHVPKQYKAVVNEHATLPGFPQAVCKTSVKVVALISPAQCARITSAATIHAKRI